MLSQGKGIALVAGESGVGKSHFLAKLYDDSQKHRANYLVALHTCRFSESFDDPIVNLLSHLIAEVRSSHLLSNRSMGLLAQTSSLLNQLIRQDVGLDFVRRLLEKVTLNWGPLGIKVDSVFGLTSNALERIKGAKPSILDARRLIAEHRLPAADIYGNIIKSLSEDLSGKYFLLVVDQLERADSTTLNLMLDLAEAIQNRVCLVLAIQVEIDGKIGEPHISSEKYRMVENAISRIGGKIIQLQGLRWDEIGEWIKKRQKKQLPEIDLKKIRKATGGLPIIIREWLERNDLAIELLQGLSSQDYLGRCYEHRLEEIESSFVDFAYRLSVLREPLPLESYVTLLRLGRAQQNLLECHTVMSHLKKKLIFDDSGWFRHETIKRYVENRMPVALQKEYHYAAARLFKQERERKLVGKTAFYYPWYEYLSEDYHLRRAGKEPLDFVTNYELFNLVVWEEPWDTSSLSSVSAKKALLERLQEYFNEVGDKLGEAWALYWLGHAIRIIERRVPYNPWDSKMLYERSLDICKILGDREGISIIFLTLHA